MTDTLLVTGACGQLGRRVVHHLLETLGVAPQRIVAATRNPAALAELAAKGVDVRRLDFDDPASLAPAFAGADRALVISTDAAGQGGRRLVQHKAAVEAARQAGVGHLLYTSMIRPENSAVLFANEHLGTEQAIAATGIPHTILRCGWYQENLLSALPPAIASGQWYTSAGDGRIAHVARDDIAAAAAAALASGSTESKIYNLTGPEALTTAAIAALASEIAGRPIAVVQLSDEALAQGLKAAGVPEAFVPIVVSFDTNTRLGGIDLVSGDVEALTGRPPVPLRAFLESVRPQLAGAAA